MGNRLEGRVAIVTGAGRGIGREVALLMAREGASVVVNDLGSAVDGSGDSAMPSDKVTELIRQAGGIAIASHDSISEFESAGNVVQTAVDHFGGVDILCNAAGVLRDRMVFNMTEEEWDTVLQVHLLGAFNMVRNVIPYMKKKQYGRIVLLASRSGLGSAGQANYAAAKEGTVGFARAMANELAPVGITVSAVYPSAATRMTATVPESAWRRRRQQAIAINNVQPEMISQGTPILGPKEARAAKNNAPKIVYLCTETGGFLTGQVIGTGGWSMDLYPPRHIVKSIDKNQRWTLDELDDLIPISLGAGLVNPATP